MFFRNSFFIIAISLFVISFSANAERRAAAIDYLHGSDDINGIRIAYRPVTHARYTSWFGEIKLYWETSFNIWEYGSDNKHATNLAIAISPVIEKQLTTIYDEYRLYLEAGIGASLVNDRHFAGKDIGSHYQFEDRLGFLLSLDPEEKNQVALRYMHYSNGGLNSDNPGLDFLSLSYSYNF